MDISLFLCQFGLISVALVGWGQLWVGLGRFWVDLGRFWVGLGHFGLVRTGLDRFRSVLVL